MLYRGSHDDRYTKDGEKCARISVWIEMYHCHTVAEFLNENTGVVNLGFKLTAKPTSRLGIVGVVLGFAPPPCPVTSPQTPIEIDTQSDSPLDSQKRHVLPQFSSI